MTTLSQRIILKRFALKASESFAGKIMLLFVTAFLGYLSTCIFFSPDQGRAEMKLEKKLLEVSVARPRPADWNRDPMDYTKPRTFFDIAIDGKSVGRIEFELFTKQSPRAAENFRALCTGEKGRVPVGPGREGAGKALHFKGYQFYRVIDQFICQTGAEVESVYGGMFQDDEGGIRLKHDRKGLLSMANMGPNTNTAHFSIMMAPAHHLDGHYTIFGQVVSGIALVDRINALAKPGGVPDERPQLPVQIVACGQLDCSSGVCQVMRFEGVD